MACGSYWTRHIVNLSNKLTGGTIDDPRWLWNRFCIAYKTSEYDPEIQGSALQDQLAFARRLGLIDASYRISVSDIELAKTNIKIALKKWHFILTGSKKINWKATRASKDKVAVMGIGSAHIVAICWYNEQYLLIQQSSGDEGYDKGWMYLKWDDIGCLFSMYGVIDRGLPSTMQKIAQLIEEKKKTMWYWVKFINGRNKMWRRPK
jgi:hypothetical protein